MRQYIPEEVQEYFLANSKELEIKFPVMSLSRKVQNP